jgi:Zn-dependent protease
MFRFGLFGVPVQVDFWFFLTALLVRPDSTTPHKWTEFVLWIVIVFTGVLLHEAGHAGVGRVFGEKPAVRLSWIGGLTSWESGRRLSPRRSILVSLAGPAVGIAAGLVFAVLGMQLKPVEGSLVRYVIDSLVWVNLGWGLLNLVPILPLDGGRALLSALEWFLPRRGPILMHALSFAGSVMGAGVLVLNGVVFLSLLLALFAWSNWNAFDESRAAFAGKKLPAKE